MNTERQEAKWVNEIVGVFTDPIIVMPGGWGETLPEWIKPAITLERLIANIEATKTGVMTATDAEACAYLYTASLEAPMGSDWTQIYLYIASKVYERHRSKESGVTMPDDIRVETLSNYQHGLLADLKRWIYERRVKYRKERSREEGKGQKDRGKEKPPAVLQLAFDFGK